MRKRKECLSSKASHSFSMSRLREFNEFLATAGRHHGRKEIMLCIIYIYGPVE